jgi:hypothetical protein
MTTDASGYFTVSVSAQPYGTYNYRVKGLRNLSNCGSLVLVGDLYTNLEAGLLRAGDANNDDVSNIADFDILKSTFGRSLGQPDYDPRADFNNDNTVNSVDFAVMVRSFGQAGCGPP